MACSAPRTFPGGDIGSLAVHGTVNDLAVRGALPLALTLAVIAEEGLPLAELRAVLASAGKAAHQVGAPVITGDTKVVGRGAADRLFLNTTGIGRRIPGLNPSAARAPRRRRPALRTDRPARHRRTLDP